MRCIACQTDVLPNTFRSSCLAECDWAGMALLWRLLAWTVAVSLALSTKHEIEKAIQFVRDVDVEELRRPHGKVVTHGNSTPVPLRKFPFAVLTIIKSLSLGRPCTGIIVSENYVVTSAWCAPDGPEKWHEGIVIAGDVDYTKNKTFERTNVQVRTVSRYVFSIPPESILVMQMYRPFTINNIYVGIGDLTTNITYDPDLNISTEAIGFGNVDNSEGVMSSAHFWTVPGTECSSDLPKMVLCSKADPLTSVCDADVGGPVVVNLQVFGFVRGRVLEDPNVSYCGAPVAYSTFWFAGGYANWIYSIISKAQKGVLGRTLSLPAPVGGVRSRGAVVSAGRWTLPCLLGCSVNLRWSR